VRSADLPPRAAPLYDTLRSPAGERLILEQNFYVETALPAQVMRKLSDEEMEAYRAPFREPGESRRPILSLCLDVPVDGTPRDVDEAERSYAEWLARSPLPKLFLNVEPGSFLVGELRELCRRWPNQEEVTVPGLHFAPEDSPEAIGRALAEWLPRARTGDAR
jgi:haloalkane dehalogenase